MITDIKATPDRDKQTVDVTITFKLPTTPAKP